MTELQARLEDAKCGIDLSKLELQEAELKLAHGERFLAEAKEKYGSLKIAVETAKIKLRQSQNWAAKVETDANKGFVEDSQ